MLWVQEGINIPGEESKYELWEVKCLAHMRLQKLYDVFVPSEGDTEASVAKKADAFAELVRIQCLDDRRVFDNKGSKR